MVHFFSDMILAGNIDEINSSPEQMSEYLVMLYCTAGSMQVTINDIPHTVQPGNVLVCMPQSLVGHYMRTPDFEAKILAVGKHFYDEVLNDCFEVEPNWWQKATFMRQNPVWTLDDHQKQLLQAYIQLIMAYIEEAQTPYRQRIIRSMAQAVAFEVLAVLDKILPTTDNSAISSNTITGPKDRILLQFMHLLNQPGNTMRDVQSYAHQMLITPKYLSAVCKEKTNRTASDWINQIMANHIRHFLTQTAMSIKEIAYQMDFPDVSFFCKFTKKHLGQSPLDYRKTQRNFS